MIVMISPAKTFKTRFYTTDKNPYFNKGAQNFIAKLTQLDKDTIIKRMKVSSSLAEKIIYDYNHFGEKKNPAIFSYYGHQYKYFDIDSIDSIHYPYIHEHLFILSGLYGLLKAFDNISTYRLEMQDKTLMNLVDYWKPKITCYIKKFYKDEMIINLCSHEYGQLISDLDQTINISFKQNPDNLLHSMEVKKLRGLFAREIMLNPDKNIKSIGIEGYIYQQSLSDKNNYTYIKEFSS